MKCKSLRQKLNLSSFNNFGMYPKLLTVKTKKSTISRIESILRVLIINFGELGAAEDLRFRQNAFDTIFFSSMHIFLSLPKNEIQKKLRNGPPCY